MIRALLARLKQGRRVSLYPLVEPTLPDRFRGRPVVDPAKCPSDCRECASACPTDAISVDQQGWNLDLGRCLFCTDCSEACPEGAITYSSEYRLAARTREDLRVSDNTLRLVSALDEKMQRLFGRSLKLRQVSAGGCNACDADVNVL